MTIFDMLLLTDEGVMQAFHTLANKQKRTVWESDTEDMFLFIEGNMPVCLVAHVDTVSYIKGSQGKTLKQRNGIITAWKEGHQKIQQTILGADDRAGCYILYDILRNSPLKPHVLLTNYEESGGLGAREFANSDLHKMYMIEFFIELDRKGVNHYVQYNRNPKEVNDWMEQFNLPRESGSYSDIKTITEITRVPSVNIATGYYLQHTTREYLDIAAMELAKTKTLQLLADYIPNAFGLLEEKPFIPCAYENVDVRWIDEEPDIYLLPNSDPRDYRQPRLFNFKEAKLNNQKKEKSCSRIAFLM